MWNSAFCTEMRKYSHWFQNEFRILSGIICSLYGGLAIRTHKNPNLFFFQWQWRTNWGGFVFEILLNFTEMIQLITDRGRPKKVNTDICPKLPLKIATNIVNTFWKVFNRSKVALLTGSKVHCYEAS